MPAIKTPGFRSPEKSFLKRLIGFMVLFFWIVGYPILPGFHIVVTASPFFDGVRFLHPGRNQGPANTHNNLPAVLPERVTTDVARSFVLTLQEESDFRALLSQRSDLIPIWQRLHIENTNGLGKLAENYSGRINSASRVHQNAYRVCFLTRP